MNSKREDDPAENTLPEYARRIADWLLAIADRLARYAVVIPWNAEVRWPDRCMQCGHAAPDHVWSESVQRPSRLSVILGFDLPWRRRWLDVPLCTACMSQARVRRRRARVVPLLALLVILLGGLALASLVAPVSLLFGRIIQVTAVIGSIAIAISLGLRLDDPPIEVHVRDEHLHIELKDRDLAEALAAANDVEVREPSG